MSVTTKGRWTMNWELIFELILIVLRIVSAGQAD